MLLMLHMKNYILKTTIGKAPSHLFVWNQCWMPLKNQKVGV
jgi:hypothetical protein